ncbi:hypothetical protein Tco_0514486 [Tanacetum coccineum]
MLAKARVAGQILEEEQLAFLADPGIPDGQAAQTTISNTAAFQTEDLDAYDSDCDDVSNAKAVLMANLSNYGSDVILEVPNFEPCHTDMDNQSVHAMQGFEQTSVVDFTDNEITASVSGDARVEKERVKSRRVRGMILAAQSEAFKQENVLLKVSPWKSVVRFGKKGKLAPRYVGPFKILERIGPIAYRLRLHEELIGVHDTFHEPVEIMDHEVKSLKRSRIPLVKVCWNSKCGPEFTWEREDYMKSKYPQLFVDRVDESARAQIHEEEIFIQMIGVVGHLRRIFMKELSHAAIININEIVDLTGIPYIHDVASYAFLMKDPVEGVSDFYNKRAWQNCYSSFIKPLGGQSMWVKTGLPPLMPPKKRVMPGSPKGKRQKHPDESGFESAASALKRMRMDATASGSGLSKEEDADPANVDHANADPGEMEHKEMEQPVHMEKPVNMEEPVHMEEPVQEADVQEPILRRGLRLRRPSHRILLNKWKKPFQFDEHGTGSTTEKAFDISDE